MGFGVQVRTELTKLDPYFDTMGEMMEVWLDAWEATNPGHKGYEKPVALSKVRSAATLMVDN